MDQETNKILTRSQRKKMEEGKKNDLLVDYNSDDDEDYNPMDDENELIDDVNNNIEYESETESLDEYGNIKDLIDDIEVETVDITKILTQYIVNNINERIEEELLDDPMEEEEQDQSLEKDQIKYNCSKDKGDILYFNKLSPDEKSNILSLETNIKSINTSITPLRFRILESHLDLQIKANAIRKLDSIKRMDMSANEYHKIKNWIDGLLNIPFNNYKQIPINTSNTKTEISDYLYNSQKYLNESVYGHNTAKCHILQIISQWIANPNSIGNVLAIHGPMGIGKTTLVKEGISKALNKPYSFVSLGGSTDSAYLEGHSYTYEGSQPGRVVDILTKAKCMNPIIYFDELDKVSDTPKGEEIINLLVHMTDSSQNSHFQDKYYSGIDLDLSKCLFIFSYNDSSKVNPILADRMHKIKLDKFNTKDKLIIAKKYLLPNICKNFNIDQNNINLSDDNIEYIINKYATEDGVRNLKRAIETIISKVNILLLTGNKHNLDLSYKIIDIDFPINLSNTTIDSLLENNSKDDDPPPMMYT